jgi:hypothetical protein
VVAEHDHRAIAEIAHEAQRRERSRTAVDQVADKPDPVACAIEPECRDERLQLVEAALDVADSVGGQPTPPARCRCGE